MSCVFGSKQINDWLNDPRKPKGTSRLNLQLLRHAKQLYRDLGGIRIVTIFLMTHYDMKELGPMFKSAEKQRALLRALKIELKKHEVTPEWKDIFVKDLSRIKKRVDHVYKIIEENLYLTDLYPFFHEVGIERLRSFESNFDIEGNATTELVKEIEEYRKLHKEEIARHLETIKEEKDIVEKHRAKVKEDIKAEKDARKQAQKEERERIKEMKEYQRKNRAEEKRLEREAMTAYRRSLTYEEVES